GNVELNDGLIYNIPLEGSTLDDRTSVDETWAYRTGGDPPMATGITAKEGVIVLTINIAASTLSEFETRLNALKALFNTQDPNYGRFYRQLSTETYYKYLEVAPRQFNVNRITRQVTI